METHLWTAAVALLLACAAATPPAAQTVYTVNATADPGDGTCDAAECTLREALDAANGHPNGDQPDEVHFDIPGSGVHTIGPASALPAITDPVVIDGYTQPGGSPNTLAVGNDAVLRIELDGTRAGVGASALVITAGHSIVRGLVINRFAGDGIVLQTDGGNSVTGCFIGTDASGTTALLVGGASVFLDDTAENTIGGTDPAARNVLIGNLNPAVYTEGTGAGDNTIQGNYVGTNADGTAALGLTGILLTSGGNLVGGTAPGAGNVISTLGRAGIMLDEEGAAGNTIQGNYIGVTADGITALSATGSLYGIEVQRAPGALIGGPTAAARNVIVATTGIYLFGAAGSGVGAVIQGNYIGTNAAGTAALPGEVNAGSGIRIEGTGNHTVGGTEAGAGNVIAGFSNGIQFYDALPGNVVRGNHIGVAAEGMAALPNVTGIAFAGFGSDDGNLIGGAEAGARNVISGNLGHGLYIGDGTDNTIQGNYIGVAADGTTPLGNGGDGIQIGQGDGNRIGGTAPGQGNVIAYNGPDPGDTSDGIRLFGGHGNALLGNAIYGNRVLGINLVGGTQGPDEATENDAGDGDDGPNALQNFPVLSTSTLDDGQLSVVYSVDTDPALAAYPLRVEFFRVEGGQGAAFLGADTYAEADYGSCGSPPCAKTATFAPAAPVVLSDALVATATDAAGNTSEFTSSPVDVPAEPAAVPAASALYAPVPNPAPSGVALRYDVAEAGPVRLVVYDVLGREVAVLVDGERPAGHHTATWTGRGVAAGLYLVRLDVGEQAQTRRLTLVR